MITPETHDHALNCETTLGRGCDCGLTGMAGVACYVEGAAVYKTPVEKQAVLPNSVTRNRGQVPIIISPELTDGLAADKDIKEIGEAMHAAKEHAAAVKYYEEVLAQQRKKVMDSVFEFFKPRRAAWGDATDLRKVNTAQLFSDLD